IQVTVKEKRLWLLSGRASFFAEDVPIDVLSDNATLQAPPRPLAGKDILPDNLPEAWNGNIETTALAIADALSTQIGKVLPWMIVRDAISAAFNARLVERSLDSGPWPCDYAGARAVKICQRQEQALPPKKVAEPPPSQSYTPTSSLPGVMVTEATLSIDQIQDLYEQVAAI